MYLRPEPGTSRSPFPKGEAPGKHQMIRNRQFRTVSSLSGSQRWRASVRAREEANARGLSFRGFEESG